MTDVLLASANFMALDPKQMRKRRPYPPLATLQAAARLREAGLSVSVFDATLAPGEDAFCACLSRVRPRVVALYEDNFNFLSKMCLVRMRQAAQAMIAASRASGARVVAAGSDITDRPRLYLSHGAEFALIGEPDHTLLDVVDILLARRDGDAASVPGVAVASSHAHDGVRRAPARAPERHPDVFPPPAWDLVDIDAYRRVWREAHGYFSLNLVTTRGCPFHCNWCAKPIWGQRYAIHSPRRAAEDVRFLTRHFAPDHVWFADDIFGLRPAWVVDFARELHALDARVPFTIQTRVDLLTDDAVAALAKAGCVEAWIGAESGSQAVLDAMEKGTSVEDIAVARARLRNAGIRASFFIQFGYPGETFDDIVATVRMVRELVPDDIGVSVSYPLPGTPFFERVRAQLGEKTNWTDSDDLAMMFEGTYESGFYRRLHSLLHRELTLRQAIARGDSHDANDLAVVLSEWQEIAACENEFRTRAPVLVSAAAPRPRPDLSRDWN